jgi:Virulence factor membrane-bound polymerase, C-terminal/Protein glycosylation ligase/O-Antigen ligase
MFRSNFFNLDEAFSAKFWSFCTSLCLSVAWFIPNHYPPLHDFFNEAWIAIFIACLWLWAVTTHKLKPKITLPFAALLLYGFALVPIAQWMAGLLPYSGQALLTSAYLLACALVLSLGFALPHQHQSDSINILWTAILTAALANAIVIFIQKTGLFPYDDISFPGVLVFQIHAPRSTGNLGQANQMGTLLVWGLLSTWWFLRTRQIRFIWFFSASLILTLALVCTQSRTAFLNIFVVGLIGFMLQAYAHFEPECGLAVNDKSTILVPVLWLLMIGAGYAILHVFEQWFGLNTELRTEVMVDAVRSIIYPRFFSAALDSFWFGYGWSHLAKVQMDFPLDGIELGVYFLHSHSIFLDLILWLGVPTGLCAISLLLFGLLWLFSSVRTVEHFILVAIPLVLFVHSAVEFPHMYAYFLLPVAWLIGIFSSQLGSGKDWHASVRLYFLNGLASVLIFVLVACIWDQHNISRELMLIRLKSAKIMTSEIAQIDSAIILNQFEDRLRFQYMPPARGTSEQQLNWMRSAVIGYPVPITHYNLIGHLALNGHEIEAQMWMKRFNNITTQLVAQEFAKRWEIMRKNHPELTLAAWPVTGALLVKTLPQIPSFRSTE